MGARYIADSNTVLDLMLGRMPTESAEWFDRRIAKNQIVISVITRIELLTKTEPIHEFEHMQKFVQIVEVLPLDEPVIWQTILLRQQQIVKRIPDCIIAATALEHGLVLLTRDKDFNGFQNSGKAVVLNPYENFQQDLVVHGLVEIDFPI